MRILMRVGIPFLAACGLVLALSATPFSWAGWSMEYCGLQNCYCEAFKNNAFVRQPWTAASNLAYVLVGLIILASRPAKPPVSTRAFGWALLAAGAFSFLSHASLTRAGEWLDLVGVYAILGLILRTNIRRLGWLSIRSVNWLYAGGMIAGGLQMVFVPAIQQILVLGLAAGGMLTEMLARRVGGAPTRLLRLSAALLLAGGLIWVWYGRAPVCDPQSGWPWHTAWHILSAAGLGCYYFYLASNKIKN